MKLRFETQIPLPLGNVQSRFNQTLLDYLKPPFPLVKILKYEGNHAGAIVDIELNFVLFKFRWISLIAEEFCDNRHYYFIDEGLVLPPFLKAWKHRHEIQQTGENSCIIIDDIEFESATWWPGFFVKFMLWIQFSQRPGLYKKFFLKN